MSIFNLLFDNIFFVVVVVGFIFSMLAKMGKSQNTERKPERPAGMPPFNGGSSMNGRRNIPRPPQGLPSRPVFETREYGDPRPMRTAYLNESPIETTENRAMSRAMKDGRSSVLKEDDAIASGNIADFSFKEKPNAPKIEASQIVQGIIWSEILSPPRAKRHFRR